MEGDLVVNSRVTVRRDELTFRFSRSGGPGGQNVNKLETRVEVVFDLARSPSLSDPEKELARGRLTRHCGDASARCRRERLVFRRLSDSLSALSG